MAKAGGWRAVLARGVRVILPEVCAGCGIAGAWICDECLETVRWVDQRRACQHCGQTAAALACRRCQEWPEIDLQVRSACEFDGAVRESILRMKYRGEFSRASWHGEMLAGLYLDLGWQVDCIVPVPLHRNTRRRRSYNQSEKLAQALSSTIGVEFADRLERRRDTPSQTQLTGDQRRQNVSGAFGVRGDVAGMRVLLVDDVVTTGSTLLACATALVDAGVQEVRALTIATDV